MALYRQETGKFKIDEREIDATLRGDVLPLHTAPSLSQDEDEAIENEAGFGEGHTRTRAALSEFTNADPLNAAGAAEKLRRDINSPLNIGGGGGALYTEDKNPWGQNKDEKKDDVAQNAMGDMVEQAQESLKRDREVMQRQREEQWANMMNDEYGINLTPGQWKRVEDIMSDDSKRKKHFDDLQKKNGWTDKQRDEAEKAAMEIIRLKQLYAQGKISEDELKKRMGDLKAENPTAFKDAGKSVEAISEFDSKDASTKITDASAQSRVKQTDDVQVARVEQKAEVKALPSGTPQSQSDVSFGRAQFPTAPNATNDFSAVNNPQPAKVETAPAAQPNPVQIASIERKFDAVAL